MFCSGLSRCDIEEQIRYEEMIIELINVEGDI